MKPCLPAHQNLSFLKLGQNVFENCDHLHQRDIVIRTENRDHLCQYELVFCARKHLPKKDKTVNQ